MTKFCLGVVLISAFMTFTAGNPGHHHEQDPYSPVIDFLKQLRKARKHSGSVIGNREGEEGTIASSPSFSFNQQSQPQTQTPILFPQQSNGNGNSGSGSSNGERINIQLPASYPNIPRPTSSPQDITRVNNGVSTILQGVRSFDLGQILRGAFIFPRNENVKSVANNVLDNIFGGSKPPTQN